MSEKVRRVVVLRPIENAGREGQVRLVAVPELQPIIHSIPDGMQASLAERGLTAVIIDRRLSYPVFVTHQRGESDGATRDSGARLDSLPWNYSRQAIREAASVNDAQLVVAVFFAIHDFEHGLLGNTSGFCSGVSYRGALVDFFVFGSEGELLLTGLDAIHVGFRGVIPFHDVEVLPGSRCRARPRTAAAIGRDFEMVALQCARAVPGSAE
ncbi:MAG: hypothetical protein K1X75_15195 [Leptospirales bacterium]|nr:hypothetical protein [Leptospirales bacterium]